MTGALFIAGSLGLGVVLAIPYVVLGGLLGRAPLWWGGGLVVAGLIYVAFAVATGAPAWVVGVEAVGAALCVGVVWRGWRDLRWIAAGWALHPLWDVGVHALGGVPAPAWYVWACVSFDVLVGAVLWRWARAGAMAPEASASA